MPLDLHGRSSSLANLGLLPQQDANVCLVGLTWADLESSQLMCTTAAKCKCMTSWTTQVELESSQLMHTSAANRKCMPNWTVNPIPKFFDY